MLVKEFNNIINEERKMDPINQFYDERVERIKSYQLDDELNIQSKEWLEKTMRGMYVYNFDWLGRPIIQYPQDIVAMQELIWEIKPDLIIETGIAHGGSLVLSASMLALLDMSDAIENGTIFNPKELKRKVLGLDIDIRAHNREAIKSHPMSKYIQMLEGSSIELGIIEQVKHIAKDYTNILVCLDSNHTHKHVLAELNAYAELVSKNSYCVVFDTFVEDMPDDLFPERPWGIGNNPKTAVNEFLNNNKNFIIDQSIQNKLLVTVAPNGFLKHI